MHPGGLKMFAIGRAIDRIFPLRAAALGTNLAADAWAVPARTLLFTQLTGSVHQQTLSTLGNGPFRGGRTRTAPLSYHRDMARIDLHLKVVIDTDDNEPPERLAQEICRIVRRIYGVRQAEISNMVEKEP